MFRLIPGSGERPRTSLRRSKRPSSTGSNTARNKSCLVASNPNPVEDYFPHPRMRPSKSCPHINGRPTVLGTKSFWCQAAPPMRSKPEGGPSRTPVEKCVIPPAVSNSSRKRGYLTNQNQMGALHRQRAFPLGAC